MEKISFEHGKLTIPNRPVVPYIEGDGIGIDITPAMLKVVDAAIEKAYGGSKKITWKEVLAGEKAFNQTGEWLPKETTEAFKEYHIGIKGPLTTPIGGGIRSLNVAIRQVLDLYVCLRPVRWFQGVPSPIKEPHKVNMHIFRENTEDIYAGIEFMAGDEKAAKLRDFLASTLEVNYERLHLTTSFGIKPVSKEGSERLIRAAIRYAIARKLPTVTLVHKGNIMKFTEGAFKNWGYELAEREFGDRVFTWAQYDKIAEKEGKEVADKAQADAQKAGKVIIQDAITDAFFQFTLLRPTDHSVVATMNLNGDYLSDQLAAMVGGIGIAPGANINYEKGYAVFEATHGTAPKHAGLDRANPCSLLLSAVMMLEYMEWQEAADSIIKSLETTIQQKTVTYDLERLMEGATKVSTSNFADKLISNL